MTVVKEALVCISNLSNSCFSRRSSWTSESTTSNSSGGSSTISSRSCSGISSICKSSSSCSAISVSIQLSHLEPVQDR